jgi:PAS domain-containing protein
VSFVLDLSGRKRAEAEAREMQLELAHANRVATMGQLTASVAHEVNQPIAATVINANSALRWLSARPPDLAEVRQALARIARDGKRAGDVVDRIRVLVKRAPPRMDGIAINDAILEVIALTQSEASKNGVSVCLPQKSRRRRGRGQAAISLENTRLYHDLTERAARIRRLVDANIIGICLWKIDGDIIEANDAFLRIVGYERDDLVSGRVHRRDLTPAEWLSRR